MVKIPLIALLAMFGVSVYADETVLVPIPDPQTSVKQEQKPPVVQTPVCKKSTVADVYTVKDLTVCGQRIDNSGLGGLFNRGKCCAVEKTLAQVFAAPCTCEDCASRQRAAEIRCQRGNHCTCQDEEYVKSLVTDLMDGSRRVRLTAVRSLRKCGFRVDHERACVDAEVPSAILY